MSGGDTFQVVPTRRGVKKQNDKVFCRRVVDTKVGVPVVSRVYLKYSRNKSGTNYQDEFRIRSAQPFGLLDLRSRWESNPGAERGFKLNQTDIDS